jgi:hypothetical protein
MPLQASRVLPFFPYAMYFNGVNAYVRIPLSPSLEPRNAITIEAWIKPISAGWSIINRGIVWHGDSTVPYGFWIDVEYGNMIKLRLNNDDVVRSPPNAITLDVWQDLVGAWDGSVAKIYKDGSLIASARWTATLLTSTQDVYVGVAHPNMGWFYGYICGARIYSRALSDSEVAWNYSYPDNPVHNGLVLWLKADPQYVKDIDNDGILEWIDLSGYGNHGKIYGAQLVQLIKSPSRVVQAQRVLSCAR